jgi:hypothetical protein
MLPPNSKIKQSYIIIYKDLQANVEYFFSQKCYFEDFSKARTFKRKCDVSRVFNNLKKDSHIWLNHRLHTAFNPNLLHIKIVYTIYNENLQ